MQEEIIRSVMDGRDTLAVLPTGGGKSLCYQVPGMARPGLCLIISPLIALMKDQVYSLARVKVKARALMSGMSHREMETALDNCRFGDVKFLFVSPERLETRLFREQLHTLDINLLAVDEAHCISQWGYDLRPPYLRIADIREQLPEVPVLALTATATPSVREDIMEKLRFREPNMISGTFFRAGLRFVVRKTENKRERLEEILDKVPGSCLVYVSTRRTARELSDYLKKKGYSVSDYHAGLERSLRIQRQNEWTRGDIRIMVCTNAFGMGIDKSDVRLVLHYDLPESLEAYYQEAGRAGRDGKKAYAVLLYENRDLHQVEQIIEQKFPPLAYLQQVYRAIGLYLGVAIGAGLHESYDFDFRDFCARYNLDYLKTFNAFRLLEQENYLSLTDEVDLAPRIRFLVDNRTLYKFEVEHPDYSPLLRFLLRNHMGAFEQLVRINENLIARHLGIRPDSLVRYLESLGKMDILEFEPRKSFPQLMWLTERLDEKNLRLDKKLIVNRKKALRQRLQAMNDYALNQHKCRSQFLAGYFGENLAERCGICDICEEIARGGLNDEKFEAMAQKIETLIRQSPLSAKDLVRVLKTYRRDDVEAVVRWLISQQMVRVNEVNELIWQA